MEPLFTARRLPAPYNEREFDEQTWRCRFGSDFCLADRLMAVVCEAFRFDPTDRFKFRPEDSVADIYSTLYPKPTRWYKLEQPDILEINFLIDGLEETFGITFDDSDSQLEKVTTFAQIVDEIKDAIGSRQRCTVASAVTFGE